MFNQHLYPSFHSLKDFFEETHKRPLTANDDDRMTKLTIWKEALTPRMAKTVLPTESKLRQMLDRAPQMRRLSFIPKKLSRLAGIEKFFDATNGQVVTPSAFQNNLFKKFQHKFFYLIPRNVTVVYGPYHYLGILDYRTERLHGLLAGLKFAGANTFLRPSNHINHVSVWYLEREIFTCKITDLHHGGDGELDPLAYEAAMAFKSYSKKVLLNVRHKYTFDKQKGNLFRKCPCHEDYPGSPFMSDDDNYEEEFLGEGEYIDPYAEVAEYNGETDSDDEMFRGGKILRRISLPSHLRVKFVPRKLREQLGEYEMGGEEPMSSCKLRSLQRKSTSKRYASSRPNLSLSSKCASEHFKIL
ncbi:unnamed protein product [Allacma fusca]|uniref:Uncharacterized protein n=1 Tax=Allacma fusca TaxID=39272 RepID=A0A8J2LMZ6_9HEXA|nr:unnamed protein product [Allacma fusca]